ncbi:7850_t:CDS:2 [Dentiscutata erythropus]|uniref:7850_t:CDS:1 n=1 Tax=Dentiscutata erythropus TaxID=1348616 RepID=A0A9N9GTA9_9GLOM|nr:7850_t:CDS:2 [Dentiscutata erythropus]
MGRTRKVVKKINDASLRSTETNNSVDDQATNIEVTSNKRKNSSNLENHELQATNVDVTSNKGKKSSNRTNTKKRIKVEPSFINNDKEIIQSSSPSLIKDNLPSKNSAQQRKQVSNASSSSSLIKNTSSYKQQSSVSKTSPSFSVRNGSPEKAGGQGSTDIQQKANEFNILPEKPNASERTTLQKWAFACFRDYNAFLRKELRNLVPKFIRKYKLTKSKPPELKQLYEYITENNWQAFLKYHMDILDLEKTFRKRPENVAKFTKFI